MKLLTKVSLVAVSVGFATETFAEEWNVSFGVNVELLQNMLKS